MTLHDELFQLIDLLELQSKFAIDLRGLHSGAIAERLDDILRRYQFDPPPREPRWWCKWCGHITAPGAETARAFGAAWSLGEDHPQCEECERREALTECGKMPWHQRGGDAL